MNYRLHYDLLIAKARDASRSKHCTKSPDYIYYEKHHVIPKCLGGSNAKSNLVLLTAREHFIAHWLLTKFAIGQDRYKCLAALSMFSKGKSMRNLNSRQYGVCRKACATINTELAAQGLHASQKPENRARSSARLTDTIRRLVSQVLYHTQTDEYKQMLSAKQIALVAEGKHHFSSEESRARSSATMTNTVRRLVESGQYHTQTDEYKQKLSARNKALSAEGLHNFQSEEALLRNSKRANTKLRCEHCGLVGGYIPMKRHHLANCKFKTGLRMLVLKEQLYIALYLSLYIT